MFGESGAVDPPLARRRFLTAIATGAAGALAGCSPFAGDGTDDRDREPTVATTADSSGERPELSVAGRRRIDEPVQPTVTGLEPGARIPVRAATTLQTQSGTQDWTARAVFDADENGRVDLASAGPVEGSYSRVDPMGLFWSMRSEGPPAQTAFPLHTHSVTLTAAVGNDTVTATTRRVLPSVAAESLGDGLVGRLCYRPEAVPGPGVVLLHGSQARPMTPEARLLAEHGFVAASLQYFGEPTAIPDDLAEVPIEYVERAVARLADSERVAGSTVGLYGISKGAELALLAGAHIQTVGAVVSIAGGAHAWEGGSSFPETAGTSSWRLDGEPVPYVPYASDPMQYDTSRALFEASLEAAASERIVRATIPVEDIDGPVLLVSGGDDTVWNTERYSAIALERLQREGHPHPERLLVYEDAGHVIQPPYRSTYGLSRGGQYVYGGTPSGNARAASDYWPVVLRTLRGELGSR